MNLFNALTGKEAKQVILNEVTRALENDSEFREHLTFPRVRWSWRLEMHIYPRTPEEKIVEATGEAVQMKTEKVGEEFVMSRDENGQLVPVVPENATYVKEVLQSAEREVMAPDAVRAAEGMETQAAQPGGIRIARRAEVGKAAQNPTVSPGLNR